FADLVWLEHGPNRLAHQDCRQYRPPDTRLRVAFPAAGRPNGLASHPGLDHAASVATTHAPSGTLARHHAIGRWRPAHLDPAGIAMAAVHQLRSQLPSGSPSGSKRLTQRSAKSVRHLPWSWPSATGFLHGV